VKSLVSTKGNSCEKNFMGENDKEVMNWNIQIRDGF
jgi:hypothetical protein